MPLAPQPSPLPLASQPSPHPRLRSSPPPRPRLTFNLTLAGEGAGARAAGHDRRGGLPRAGGRHQDDVGLGGRPLLSPRRPAPAQTDRSEMRRLARACCEVRLGRSMSRGEASSSSTSSRVVLCLHRPLQGFPYAGPRENGRHGVFFSRKYELPGRGGTAGRKGVARSTSRVLNCSICILLSVGYYN